MRAYVKDTKGEKRTQSLFILGEDVRYLYVVSLELTYAGLHALRPSVFHVSVPGSSALLVPSTARSATTDSSGFLKRAARWTS